MEQFEISEATINFGKGLIKHFGSNLEDDPLVQWVCMHLARLIEMSEKQSTDPMAPVHHECLVTIKALWASRAKLPYLLRPFEEWETMAKTICALEQGHSWYFHESQELKKSMEESSIPEGARNSLQIALALNDLAPGLILFCLRDAAKLTDNEFVWEALEMAEASGGGIDVNAIRILRSDIAEMSAQNREIKKSRLNTLHDHVSALEALLAVVKTRIKEDMDSYSAE